MKRFILKRIAMTKNFTAGVLSEVVKSESIPLCVALERPWKGNERCVSCVPRGHYTCERVTYGKHKGLWRLLSVEGRTAIDIHVGNYVRNSLGCILLGKEFDGEDEEFAIRESADAVNLFMRRTAGLEKIELHII